MSTIYTTNEWNGYGEDNFYWNEYRLEGDKVYKYRGHRQKHFDGTKSTWYEGESVEGSWSIHGSDMPEWLQNYL